MQIRLCLSKPIFWWNSPSFTRVSTARHCSHVFQFSAHRRYCSYLSLLHPRNSILNGKTSDKALREAECPVFPAVKCKDAVVCKVKSSFQIKLPLWSLKIEPLCGIRAPTLDFRNGSQLQGHLSSHHARSNDPSGLHGQSRAVNSVPPHQRSQPFQRGSSFARLLVTAQQQNQLPHSASGSEEPAPAAGSADKAVRAGQALANRKGSLRDVREKGARPAADSPRPFFNAAAARARASYNLPPPRYWLRATAARAGVAAHRPPPDEAAAELAREIGRGCPLGAGVWDRVLMAPDPTEGLRAIARRSLVRGPDGGPAEPELAWMADMINIRSASSRARARSASQ
jgi:hypothetical protein